MFDAFMTLKKSHSRDSDGVSLIGIRYDAMCLSQIKPKSTECSSHIKYLIAYIKIHLIRRMVLSNFLTTKANTTTKNEFPGV